MKVFKTAQPMNGRLNGGNESKFPVTLSIVSEIIVFRKLRLGDAKVLEATSFLSSGNVDGDIMFLFNELDDESKLKMLNNV